MSIDTQLNNVNTDDDFGLDSDDDEFKSPLDKLFENATTCVRKRANLIAQEHLLYLYARFKYVHDGPCNVDRPGGIFNYEAKAKWDSWKSLGNSISKETAKQEYVTRLDSALPNWRDAFSSDAPKNTQNSFGKADQKGTFGIKMSTMVQEEEFINESDKTCFDLCKEGNLDKLKDLINRNRNLINEVDSDEMSLLMWACDRGHMGIIQYLVESGANVNLQDNLGQTCLHYATSCEHLSVIKYLIENSNIDLSLKDSDGSRAVDIAQNKDIIQLLSK